jgi:hypothetical protein
MLHPEPSNAPPIEPEPRATTTEPGILVSSTENDCADLDATEESEVEAYSQTLLNILFDW